MPAFTRLFAATSVIAIATFGASFVQAQERTDGSDYHPLMMNSPTNADVQAGAIAAAHPSGTESVGQSTSAPALTSTMSNADVYAGAVAASHASGTEMPGQTTSPMPLTGNVH